MLSDTDLLWNFELKSLTNNVFYQRSGIDANYVIDHERSQLIPFWCTSQGTNGVSDAVCHLFRINLDDGALISKYKFAYDTLNLDFTYSGYSTLIVAEDYLFV